MKISIVFFAIILIAFTITMFPSFAVSESSESEESETIGAADAPLKCRILYKGNTHKPRIALTFDDGPHKEFTPEILSILAKYNVKATFFFVGIQALNQPRLLERVYNEGHCIGNHTYHHSKLTDLTGDGISAEIIECRYMLRMITGEDPRLFRPPGGNYSQEILDITNELGYTMVFWSKNSGDCVPTTVKSVVSRATYKVSNGDIILLHDGTYETIEALPLIIETLRKRGFEFVTIDEMIDDL
jgi:peptidoglycan/xylan/chitin deacetylase (PgdA/CDA1 family)